ncbi:cobalt-precorrin-6A reductase [Mesorhizobium sp. RP14(2022)]|uniref:Cobalt-precorrin-6A reductase n=1 Tax=Mesorhizobium liriopis TaxID=2953882 RepID=A0ABT1C4N4_9HYPH|nr:cobalt-precorrin-6A reductase [Mesorhizobium liriopis]MCO6049795.1 cobalt-precorrin-6A reductase [Mesorhizobium liriopis]
MASRTKRILLLGGTTEARELGAILAERNDLSVTLSLAGRTRAPVAQPVPVRVGGFGGAEGLAAYLRTESIDVLIDATHPFAARISANAAVASESTGVPLISLRRPEWVSEDGDHWIDAGSVEEAVALLGATPRRVLAALGRQELGPLETAPQHFYLVRSVDPVEPPLDLAEVEYVLDRGPFDEAAEIALLQRHRISAILCKNSGGAASYPKIAAARALKLPVFMVRRPPSHGAAAGSVATAVQLLDHALGLANRGE